MWTSNIAGSRGLFESALVKLLIGKAYRRWTPVLLGNPIQLYSGSSIVPGWFSAWRWPTLSLESVLCLSLTLLSHFVHSKWNSFPWFSRVTLSFLFWDARTEIWSLSSPLWLLPSVRSSIQVLQCFMDYRFSQRIYIIQTNFPQSLWFSLLKINLWL